MNISALDRIQTGISTAIAQAKTTWWVSAGEKVAEQAVRSLTAVTPSIIASVQEAAHLASRGTHRETNINIII